MKKTTMKNNLILLMFVFSSFVYGQEYTELKGYYLGQALPRETSVVFAPGIVSVDSTVEHGYPSFSPDGNLVFWQSNLRHKEKET